MNSSLKEKFLELWKKYFGSAEVPIAFYYADSKTGQTPLPSSGHRCLFADLAAARKGKDLCFDVNTIGCSGGKRYLGFMDDLMPNFEYFLSCG